MALEIPTWIKDLPPEQREDGKRRFLLRVAALHYTSDGHLKALSTGIGLHEGTLASYLSSGQPLTAEIAVKLETALGRQLFPRELFRPDLFVASDQTK